MQAQHLGDDLRLDTDTPYKNRPLRVVIAYGDVTAGKRAMRVLADLGKALEEAVEFQPLPWSFDLLTDRDCREVATRDAVNADILIIATSTKDPLPPFVGRWADDAIHRKRGTAAAVVALFGSEENPDGAGSSRLKAIQMSARQAGLDFFAPSPRHGLEPVITPGPTTADLLGSECGAMLAKPFTPAQLLATVREVVRSAARGKTPQGLQLPGVEETQFEIQPHEPWGINE